jgi:hypothetical protein
MLEICRKADERQHVPQSLRLDDSLRPAFEKQASQSLVPNALNFHCASCNA